LAWHLLFAAICSMPAIGTKLVGHVSAGLFLAPLHLIFVLGIMRYYGRVSREYKDPAAERMSVYLIARRGDTR
jgi:hypothetical protein